MRLASKIFLISCLVVAVVAGVGFLGLRATGRLVSVNREISTQTVPALRLAGTLHDDMVSLGRLHARLAVLRDPRYVARWEERALRARQDLTRLGELVRTPDERARLSEAVAAFEQYRATAAAEQARMLADRAVTGDRAVRAHAERVEEALDGLVEATHARVVAAQTEAAALEARTWTGVVLALLSAVGLALLGSALLAWRMTRSLRRLSAATAAVAGGSFTEPLDIRSRDEIGELARSFDLMAAQLRRLDETKEEFFATLSHELRSPLTSVREAAHLLGDGVPGPLNPKQARLITLIGRSTDRLLRLVNQILELSRLRAGVLPLARARVDMAVVVARAVEELRPQAEEGGLTLEREQVGENFTAMGDEDRLVQVIVNLVANAVRFTERGGRINVRLVDAGPEVEVQVEDTGIGIPPAALPHIFESWRQAHDDRGGTGLGLAVVRGVVQAHGGRVTVESQEGKGSRFSVLMPRALAVLLLLLTLTGCAAWPLRPAARELARADQLAQRGDYSEALAAYDEFLIAHAADPATPRVRQSRESVMEILTARRELARVREELAARESELATRAGEVARLREELAKLRQEVAARQAESERLRSALERIKEIDLQAPRRRR